ncbi:MAG TPA: hypothetical protein VGH28_26145 [Polyangiaceae bacterium]|jgi:hypothetical protein
MRLWVLVVPFLAACTPQAFTLAQAARGEVYTTASCPTLDVSHVPANDVPEYREDVYVAEGCGMRWRMACESKYVEICKRRGRNCRTRLAWSCADVQPETELSDDQLRALIDDHS